MAEGIFWIFISFFAVLGILELFKMIQNLVCREETAYNILLVPVGDDTDNGAECRIHTAVADFSDTLSRQGRIMIVDVGMGEKNKDICDRLCDLYSLKTVTPDNLPMMIKNLCPQKE